jgi:predicted transcriptional regulator
VKLESIVRELNLTVRTGADGLDVEVTGGYVGDLLSDVIANAKEGDVWITRQVHQNIVAAASLKDVAAIVIVGGNEPNDDTRRKAAEEGIVLAISGLPCFETAGRIYRLIAGAGG